MDINVKRIVVFIPLYIHMYVHCTYIIEMIYFRKHYCVNVQLQIYLINLYFKLKKKTSNERDCLFVQVVIVLFPGFVHMFSPVLFSSFLNKNKKQCYFFNIN